MNDIFGLSGKMRKRESSRQKKCQMESFAEERMKKYISVFLLVLATAVLCGCSGSAEVSQADSPALQSCESYGICEGGEQDQYIIAELIFDRPVSFSEELKEQLRVVIGGQRIAPEKIEVGAVENREDAVQLKMAVQQVNDGYLEITNAPGEEKLTALTDAEGRYCAASADVKQLIPSGAAITTLKSDPAQTVCRVDQIVTHRSIIWIQLFSGNQVVEPSNSNTTDVIEGACAVHEHEFLWATKETTAADIAETVSNFYGEDFSASAEGDEITVTRKTGENAGNLELKIYNGK